MEELAKEPQLFTWSHKGAFTASAELLSTTNEVIASYQVNRMFSNKASGEWQGKKFHFDYDGSLHNNVVIFDSEKNRIGKYEESWGVTEGTIFDEVVKRNYDFRRTNHFKYHYELKQGTRLLAEIDILKQKASSASGTMTIHIQWKDEDILSLCTSLYLVI